VQIVGACFEPIRQEIRHILFHGVAAGPAVHQRINRIAAAQKNAGSLCTGSYLPRAPGLPPGAGQRRPCNTVL